MAVLAAAVWLAILVTPGATPVLGEQFLDGDPLTVLTGAAADGFAAVRAADSGVRHVAEGTSRTATLVIVLAGCVAVATATSRRRVVARVAASSDRHAGGPVAGRAPPRR